jgi:hypothetical protein
MPVRASVLRVVNGTLEMTDGRRVETKAKRGAEPRRGEGIASRIPSAPVGAVGRLPVKMLFLPE